MNISRASILIGLALILSACGIEVPHDKNDYVGRWRHPEMSLWITAAGHVEYRRAEGNVNTSVSGPLKAFDGDDFEVGIGWMSTRFDVSEPPRRADGGWKMVVDGLELTRVETSVEN
jgi:hypothetical protein